MTTFRTRVQQRWVDLDAQAHVNNARMLDYLQEARVDWLLNGPWSGLLGRAVIVVDHQVEYLGSVGVSEGSVDVAVSVGRVRASQFTLGYEVTSLGRLVCRARTRMCHINADTGRASAMPEDARAWFAEQATDLADLPDLGHWRVGPVAHEYPIRVRWSDVDVYRHVNNVTYFDYVAEARIALNAAVVPDSITLGETSAPEHRWLIARQDIRYLDEVVHRIEPYLIRTAFSGVGTTSARLVAEVTDPLDDRVLARTHTVLVHADASGVPRPLPAQLRAAAGRWAAAPAGGQSSRTSERSPDHSV